MRVLSMGFLADEEQAIMWRGLVLTRAVQQFLQDAHWGDLDYLLIDLPPGTGDVQMGLARLLPRTELLVVTTPPVAAQKVAARAADMARRGYLRVAGVIENMSDFTCEHGTTYSLFGSGGGERLARGLGVPLIGSIPLHPDLAAGGDAGVPVAMAGAGSELGAVFTEIARVVAEDVAPIVDVQGCSARLLERVEAAVAHGDAGGGLTPGRAWRAPVRRSGGRPTGLDGVLPGRRAGGHRPALLAERPQVGPQREAGHRELALGDVAVDHGQKLVDRPVAPPGEGGGDGLVAPQTVGHQGVDDLGHMVHQSPVTRCQGADGRHRVAQAGQAGQVLVEVPVGRADHHGRAVHDVVAREEERVLLDEPAQVVRGVARRVDARAA